LQSYLHTMTKAFAFIALFCVLTGCITSRISTIWKATPTNAISYNKIMVAGIFEKRDDAFRTVAENELANQLSILNYNAVSSIKEFGTYGLKSLDQEATYLALCDNGIDAVLTLALVEDSLAKTLDDGPAQKYTSLFYYNRIWNYRKLQQQTPDPKEREKTYRWECILFDLATLQPQSVMQSRSLSLAESKAMLGNVANDLIKRMLREKIIKKQNKPAAALKPF
jgi:hypothetical protein